MLSRYENINTRPLSYLLLQYAVKELKEAFEDVRLERDWMKEFSFKTGEDNVCVPLVVCFPLVEEYEKWSIVPMLRESTVSTYYM